VTLTPLISLVDSDEPINHSVALSPFAGATGPTRQRSQSPLDYADPMERRLTVEFGPSRSKRFAKAVAEAKNGPGDCSELEPGRYRTSFALGTNAAVYAGLARLLERVRHWRATEISEDDEPVSTYHAREMGWCASFHLAKFGDCRQRFYYGIFPRCALCPLFDGERAIRDVLGENPPPGIVFEITVGPNLRRLLDLHRGETPSVLDQVADASWVPDFPPEEWGQPADQGPPS
jgi:hypothetical protein